MKWPWRFPPTAGSIQVNFCRNPLCGNFGVPPRNESKRGRRAKAASAPAPGDYSVTATGKNLPALECKLCGEIFPMQSNLAIAEELLRIGKYLDPHVPVCQNEACTLFGRDDDESAGRHTRYGVNAHGTPRFKCGACRKIFAFGGRATKRQRKAHRNLDIFEHLMNSMPLRRIIKVLEISPAILYDRIDFFYDQCQAFAGEHERKLTEKEDLGRRSISLDRQKLLVNWSDKDNRKNTLMLSLASADQDTGYVYAVSVNFDPAMNREVVLRDLPRFGDHHLSKPFRRYARAWLPQDWQDASVREGRRARRRAKAVEARGGARAAVEAAYEDALSRADIEDGDGESARSQHPAQGMLLHEQTVMAAHIQLVSRLLHKAEKLRFFIDQESGLRAALLTSIPARIRNRTADAFYVTIAKNLTVDKKRSLVAKSKRHLQHVMKEKEVKEVAALHILALEELKRLTPIGKWEDRWFRHPLADMREPDKMICWLTDIDEKKTDEQERDEQLERQARLYLRASLTEVDRFFMQVRRALTIAERGIISASAERRLWFGKSAYNPAVLVKLIGIFRVYFNYCEVGEDEKTPAMRMGLTDRRISPDDIIDYEPALPDRRRAPAKSKDIQATSPVADETMSWPEALFDLPQEKASLHAVRERP